MASTEPHCYICYGGAEDGDLFERECVCRNGQQYTHLGCQESYALTGLKTLQTPRDYLLCRTCGVPYCGELGKALARALNAETAHLAVEDPCRLASKLCDAEMFLYGGEDESALPVLLELCEVARCMPQRAADFEWQLKCPILLATARANLLQCAEAERVLQAPLALLERADSIPLHLVLWANRAIAKVYMTLGRMQESERMLRDSLALAVQQPANDRNEASNILHCLDLAEVLQKAGKTLEVCHELEQLMPDAKRVFGPLHQVTCDLLSMLCEAYLSRGMAAQTEILLRGANVLEMDFDHTKNNDALLLCGQLAVALARLGKYTEALPLLEELVRAFTRLSGGKSENTLTMQSNLAFGLRELGRLGESEALYRQLLAVEREKYGERHGTTLCTQGMLAFTLMHAGAFGEAEALLNSVHEAQARDDGGENPALLVTTTNLAHCMYEQVLLRTFAEGMQTLTHCTHRETDAR